MTFEEFDYVDLDYDSMTFTIVKEGHEYTYDISKENALYSDIMFAENVEKYEVYSQEEEYLVEESDRTVEEEITELWERLEEY